MTSELMTYENVTTSSVTITTAENGNVTLGDFEDIYDYHYDYDDSMDSLPIEEVVPVSLVYGFTLLFGLGGNTLVILVVLRNERLRSITNIFLTSLASADLVLVIFCVPVKCAAFFTFTWAFGAFLCKAVHYIQAVSMVCSIMTLTVMSIERNIAILFPLRAKYLCTRGHAHMVIAIIWVLSFALASPVLVGQKHKEVGEVRKAFWCVREWVRPSVGLAFDIYMLVLLFLLPVSIMAVAYTGIARALWRGSTIRRCVVTAPVCQRSPALTPAVRSWRPRSADTSTSSSSDAQSVAANSHNHINTNLQVNYNRLDTQGPGDKNGSSPNGSLRVSTTDSGRGGGSDKRSKVNCQRSRLEQEKVKVVKMLIVVVLLFAVCWGPVLINNVMVAAGVLNRLHYGYLKPLRQAFYLLSYLNSCLNPLVYGFMSRHFRASFRQAFFSCCFVRRRHSRNPRDLASFRSCSTAASFRVPPRRLNHNTTNRKIYLASDKAASDRTASCFVEDLGNA
ncbi:galanin receptor 2a-like [Littorina saxatilis]|uniref:galanin receptor 2a-like n=1 Tax=Littorina saxatilis TaxID=31220 RepID=UPI0038B42486